MPAVLSNSIRRRTLLIVLMLLASMSSLIGFASFKDASHEIEEIFDARLAQSARILQALVLGIHESKLSDLEESRLQTAFEEALFQEASTGDSHKYESKIAYIVWHGSKRVIRSTNAPETPFDELSPGFGSTLYKGYLWETFVLKTHSNNAPFIILMAEREDVRGELVQKVVLQTMIPELIGIPTLGFMIWLAIGWGLRPLKELTSQIQHKAPNDLTPIHLKAPSSELIPIQDALNLLLNKTEAMLAREQRFIADAAHELRTPLTVLKIHSDNASRAESNTELMQSLQELEKGVNRATRIVSQLLTLARLEPNTDSLPRRKIDLLTSTRNCLAELMPLAWEKKVEISLNADEEAEWQSELEEGSLEVILQNLISNAVKFSPAGSCIKVELVQKGTAYAIRVVDSGKGIPTDTILRATERFYRSGNEAGAGLGLSIVEKIAHRHSGKLTLENSPGAGLAAEVLLPAFTYA